MEMIATLVFNAFACPLMECLVVCHLIYSVPYGFTFFPMPFDQLYGLCSTYTLLKFICLILESIKYSLYWV